MKNRLYAIYKELYSYFGPQHWWPAETPFEVMVGAILTQNTNWQNVEKAILNLKQKKLLTPQKLNRLPNKRLAKYIRSAGYYNVKAKRLKSFLKFFIKNYSGRIGKIQAQETSLLRSQLLSVKGIGKETADSILLYALKKPVFVIDAYTKRIFQRHGYLSVDADYAQAQNLFTESLKSNTELFNEYHALLVKLAKDFCLKGKPKCRICPLKLKGYQIK